KAQRVYRPAPAGVRLLPAGPRSGAPTRLPRSGRAHRASSLTTRNPECKENPRRIETLVHPGGIGVPRQAVGAEALWVGYCAALTPSFRARDPIEAMVFPQSDGGRRAHSFAPTRPRANSTPPIHRSQRGG